MRHHTPRWTEAIAPQTPPPPWVIGVLPGEGVGPEVIGAALGVLDALPGRERFELRWGGPIGLDAERAGDTPLSDEVAALCSGVFADGGAALCGPGGGRFVYDLRRRFDLFCKLAPICPCPELRGQTRLRDVGDVDLLMVRENVGGAYQGVETARIGARGPEVALELSYAEADIRRIVAVAAHAARRRRGRLLVVLKDGGLPGLSALWRRVAIEVAQGVELRCVNVDLVAYELIQAPEALDVIVAPNLFGDVLVDLAGALLGARGVTFSGNFSPTGAAVYQTSHGAAYDLAGQDLANPVGQIASLAMMLRESFGLVEEAALVELAVRRAWAAGWRTRDMAPAGGPWVGTVELGRRVAAEVHALAAAGGLA